MAFNEYNVEQQQISKKSICIALVELLKKKNYADISVTEITKKAGVSRNAYYRNFESKDQVLIEYFRGCFFLDLLDKFPEDECQSSREWDIALFNHILEHKDILSVIFRQTELYPHVIAFLHYYFVKPRLVDDMDIYAKAGKLSSRIAVISIWIIRGCPESPEELVDYMQEQSFLDRQNFKVSLKELKAIVNKTGSSIVT